MNEQEKAKESSFSLILFPFPLLPTTSRDDLCKASPLRLLAIYLKFQFNTCCAFFFAESTQITPLTDNLSMQRALRKREKKKSEVPCVSADKSHSEEAHIIWFRFYHKNHGYNTVPGIKPRKVYMLGNMQLMFCLCPWIF